MNKIIVIIFLSLSLEALHLTKHLTLQTYLQALLSQQNSIQSTLITIQQKLNATDEFLNANNSLDEEISFLESSISDYFQSLHEIENNLYLPLDQTTYTCSSTINKDGIKQQFALLSDDSISLQEQIQNLSDTSQNEQPLKDIKELDQQIQHSSDNLKLSGSQGTQTIMQSNLFMDGWIIGNQNPADLVKELTATSQNKILQYCPESSPFFDGTNCIACQQNLYFDLKDSQCIQCKKYSSQTHICEDKVGTNIKVAGDQIILPEGTELSNLTADKMCPEDNPFFSSGECISCRSPTPYFDFQLNKCVDCPKYQHFQPLKHKCTINIIFVTNLTASTNSLILNESSTLDSLRNYQKLLGQSYQMIVCPENTPFYDDNQCLICKDGMLFNYQDKICSQCPQNTFHNLTTLHCQKYAYFSNLKNYNWISQKASNQIISQVQLQKGAEMARQCPIDKPFYDGNNCISCQNQFNMDTNKCQKCSEGDYFSRNAHKCLKKQLTVSQTNPNTAQFLLFSSKPHAEWMSTYNDNLKANPNITDCPSQNPYWDDYSCISCPSQNPLFNLQYKVCTSCLQGSQYDEQIHECMQEGQVITQDANLQKIAAGIFS